MLPIPEDDRWWELLRCFAISIQWIHGRLRLDLLVMTCLTYVAGQMLGPFPPYTNAITM